MKLVLPLALILISHVAVTGQTKPKGILLEDLTWIEAEKILTSETVVVIPLGAAAKEHGPHLKLKNDWLIAEYLKKQVLKQSSVVIAPTINYNFYPAFLEYPGSTSLRLETARDLIIDVVKSHSKALRPALPQRSNQRVREGSLLVTFLIRGEKFGVFV